MFKKSKIIVGAALLAVSVLSFTLPQQAEAINLGSIAGKAVGAAKEQQEINKALNYYDNEGRHELFEALKQEDGVNSDYNANAMLGRIMQRMTPAIAKSDATINSKPYNYFVNNQEFFNAYCALGHNMSVNIGAFWFLDYNEDKLAAVIAHELVHGQKEHPIKGAKKKMSVDFVMKTVGSEIGGANGLAAQVVAVHAKNTGVTKPNEWEADNIAFTYMADAGYNVGAPAAVWQAVIESSSDSSKKDVLSDILNPSTHPKDSDRRNNYSKKLTEYSNGKVTVDANSGEVKINGKTFMTPAAAGNMSGMQRSYFVAGNLCIDLKSFYASVECVERGLDPMTAHLVVADPSRTEKTRILSPASTTQASLPSLSGRTKPISSVSKRACYWMMREQTLSNGRH